MQVEKAAIEKIMVRLEANRPASAAELTCVHAQPAHIPATGLFASTRVATPVFAAQSSRQ